VKGRWRRLWLLPFLLLAGCGSLPYHVVQPKDTLYSISFRYGMDYREVARWNHLEEPYRVSVGQHIRIMPPRAEAFAPRRPAPAVAAAVPATPAASAAAAPAAPPGSVEVYGLNEASPAAPVTLTPGDKETPAAIPATGANPNPNPNAGANPAPATSTAGGLAWQWPTARIPSRSAVTLGAANKGIDIAGTRGDPVRSAAAGRVVYSGSGIPHYGNLLIIKHDDHFLSAYAHNDRLLVGEGDAVTAGQAIAEMGDSGTGASGVSLHFEIRRDGVPVDPLKYLPGS
jgi:lipoprotein NlpD